LFGTLLIFCVTSTIVFADDWHPDDDTFDPSVHSVVAGGATRLGDPSPFVHLGLSRTGYTYVNQTHWDGFDPSVQLSLIVPAKPNDATPPGGMLLMNQEQTLNFIKAFESAVKAEPKGKRIPIKTGLKQADWALTFANDQGNRFLQLESKNKDKTDTYRFSINASKKLLGAIRHSLDKLNSESKE
tara:strand:- start:88012 stop:88566 length:555 start_codon:yes stop_codon:yes gene_type:complete